MRLCPKGHDRDLLPLASNGCCRLCQRARQLHYRKTKRGRAKANAQERTPKARARKRSYQRARRVLDESFAARDRAAALSYYHSHAEERRAYERNFRRQAKEAFPHVTDVRAAVAIFRQMRRAA